MEIASLIVSIISLTVLVIVTGIPFYRKHIEKKAKIVLVACNGIIRNDVMRIVVTYVNRNWLNAVITNSSISLCYSKLPDSKLSKVNHECSCKAFSPIVLTEKMHASIELTYSLSELKGVDLENAEVYVTINLLKY